MRKCLILGMSFVMSLVWQLVAPMSTASASSIYDNKYQTTDELSVTWQQGSNSAYRCDTETDVTDDWASYITDESKWPSNAPSLYSDLKASFETALASGVWGVSEITDQGSGSNRLIKQVIVYWTEDSSLSLAWDWDTTNLYAYSSVGHMSYATIGCTKLYIGFGGQLTGVVGGVVSGSVAAQVSNNVQVLTNDSQKVQNLFVSGGDLAYPQGYEGGYIRLVQPAPVTTPATGTVDCGGATPVFVEIIQPRNTGAAVLTQTSLGRADWSYALTSSNYAISVTCDDKTAFSSGAVPPTSTDWFCDTVGEAPYYCVLG